MHIISIFQYYPEIVISFTKTLISVSIKTNIQTIPLKTKTILAHLASMQVMANESMTQGNVSRKLHTLSVGFPIKTKPLPKDPPNATRRRRFTIKFLSFIKGSSRCVYIIATTTDTNIIPMSERTNRVIVTGSYKGRNSSAISTQASRCLVGQKYLGHWKHS